MKRTTVMDVTCLIFGKDDTVVQVDSFKAPLSEIVPAAVRKAQAIEGCRGLQLWSGGKVVYSQMGRNGVPWSENPPAIQ